jgi:hypothetical protein
MPLPLLPYGHSKLTPGNGHLLAHMGIKQGTIRVARSQMYSQHLQMCKESASFYFLLANYSSLCTLILWVMG